MLISIFTAKVLGLYLLIMGIAMLTRSNSIKITIHDVLASPHLIFLSGTLDLIIGILLVVSCNHWQLNWFLAITLIGWLTLIKGINRIFFPIMSVHIMKKFLHHNGFYYTGAMITTFLGIILSYLGFMTAP